MTINAVPADGRCADAGAPDSQLAALRDWSATVAAKLRRNARLIAERGDVPEAQQAVDGMAAGHEATVHVIERLLAGHGLPATGGPAAESVDELALLRPRLAEVEERLVAVRQYAELTAGSRRVPAAETARDVLHLLDAAPTPEASR